MSKVITLDNTVQYSKKRIKSEDVTLENFISTDNILQNKLGITQANNLPPNDLAMPSYSEGDILIANIRPYLKKIWFADKDGGCSSDVLVFETKKGYFPKFIYYNLFKDDFFDFVMKGSKGTKMPRGDKNQILDFLIPDFELPTQKKIAKVLSDLDGKIELNNKINAELEAMAKTFYDYWFVQFDFPDANGKPYKSSGGKMVWNEELKREIPGSWEAKKLEDLGNFKNGVNYDPSNPGEIACPIINVRNISASSYFIKNSDLDIIYLRENDVRKYSVHKGSIIIARSGIPGATRLISDIEANTLYCGFAIHYELINLSNKLPIFFYLKSIEEMIKNGSGGTILKNVNQATLNNLIVAFPNNELIISKFNELVDPLFDKINLIEKENQELASLRDWLLPMLMNGQVSVAPTSSATKKGYEVEDSGLGMVAEDTINHIK
jgi:type I restriction enzyme S subunit